MSGSTATLALDGEVSLADLAGVMKDFNDLLRALSAEVGSAAAIDWVIESLESGSASVTVRGESEQEEDVERAVEAYAVVGRAMEHNRPIPYRPRVQKPALRIAGRLNGRITAIRFETLDETAQLVSQMAMTAPLIVSAYGAVEGRVQTVTNRGGLRFTLFEFLTDHAVRCYLQEGQEDLMRDAWGRRASVEGIVTRNPATGRPVSVGSVTAVKVLEEPLPGSYRRARGAVPLGPNGLLPEDAIRRVRDA